MKLTRGDGYYESVLSSKHKALRAAIDLVHVLDKNTQLLSNENYKDRCAAEIEQLKIDILEANKGEKTSVALATYVAKLKAFNQIIPDVLSDNRKSLDHCLDAWRSNEFSRSWWSNAETLGNEILFVGALASAITLLALFGPPGLFVVAIFPSTLLTVFSLLNTVDAWEYTNTEYRPDSIDDRVAIALPDIEKLLNPSPKSLLVAKSVFNNTLPSAPLYVVPLENVYCCSENDNDNAAYGSQMQNGKN